MAVVPPSAAPRCDSSAPGVMDLHDPHSGTSAAHLEPVTPRSGSRPMAQWVPRAKTAIARLPEASAAEQPTVVECARTRCDMPRLSSSDRHASGAPRSAEGGRGSHIPRPAPVFPVRAPARRPAGAESKRPSATLPPPCPSRSSLRTDAQKPWGRGGPADHAPDLLTWEAKGSCSQCPAARHVWGPVSACRGEH